jgi:hypothetical protein
MPFPIETELRNRNTTITGVKEKQYGLTHEVYDGAPCVWSELQGATHTLYCGEGVGRGTRPAKLLKTILYVGIDEDPQGNIVWDKWSITTRWVFDPAIG